MFRVGPNPYGLTCTLGLQGQNSAPEGIDWFIQLAEGMDAKCIEFHFGLVSNLTLDELGAIRVRIESKGIVPIVSGPWPLSRLVEGFPVAKALGAQVVRTHLSPILCGARAEQGSAWAEIVSTVKAQLKTLGPRAVDEGLVIAIENHQDFGSRELLEFCDLGGSGVGICLDTGNPLAVGEEPIAFARRVAHKVRHVHLKDYRAQSTPEGYRLVRCAIGDGAIPLGKIAEILGTQRDGLTASLEPGALHSRHIRLVTDDWRHGYPEGSLDEIEACLESVQTNSIPAEEDYRTPLERGEDVEDICRFEQEQMRKSIWNMQEMGWLPK